MNIKEKIERAIDLQDELNSIKREFEPQLSKIARKKHPKLGDIKDVYFYSDYICFVSSGYAMGYFEEDFEIKIDELEEF